MNHAGLPPVIRPETGSRLLLQGLPEGGTAPTPWSAHEVEEQAAHDGEGLEDLHILARTEDQAEDCAAVCHPESGGSEADQDQCSPTRPQPDQQRDWAK